MTAPTSTPMADLVARQREQLAAELEASLRTAMATASDDDKSVYALDLYLIAHPEACHTAADYPNWTPGGSR